MSWHYSQVLAEEFWEENCLDGEQFVQSNKIPTASLHLPKEKIKAFSRLSPSGMTFAPLMESLGEELLMWFLEGFHVQTSQQQGKGLESREKKVASGQKWQGLLAKYDPDLHLLKTAQCSLLEDSTQSYPILPKWGLMRDGELWEQTTLGQIIKGIESGLSQGMWPTPDANMAARGTQENWTKTRPSGHQAQYTINQAVRDSMKMWPTPTANEDACGKPSGKMQKMLGNHPEVRNQGTGTLNPTWVEWLMGWPLGWTDLKPLEMDKFQKWLELHGRY